MALVFIETRTKNLPDSGALQIHKFGSATGEQRICLEGNWQSDPNLFDFYEKDVDFYFFTKSDMLDYIASIQEEINHPTQNYSYPNYPSFYAKKVEEIKAYPSEMIVLQFRQNPRDGGTAYLATISDEDGEKYNFLRSICLSSSKQGKKNAYTTFNFVKFQDTQTGRYYINLLPQFTKKYTMEELINILKREMSEAVDKHVTLGLFGLKYADQILNNSYNTKTLLESADVNDSELIKYFNTIFEVYKQLIHDKMSLNPLQKKLNLLGQYIEEHKDKDGSEFSHNHPLQKIVYGAPGTGKSHRVKEETKNYTVFRTTFHPDTDYAAFVGAYKPKMVEGKVRNSEGYVVEDEKETKIEYDFVAQTFTKAYCEAWKRLLGVEPASAGKPVCIVIEELNRGNCAQIFGDLFQLLDRTKNGYSEYSIIPEADLSEHVKKELSKVYEAYYKQIRNNSDLDKDGNSTIPEWIENSNKNLLRLCLPPNLSIVCTMNTSDQSLFPMDSAFKRRWEWEYVKIKDEGKNWIIKVGEGVGIDWWLFLKYINAEVADQTASEDKQLGYFFCKPDEKENPDDAEATIISPKRFVQKVIFYLWNDVFKDLAFDVDCCKDDKGKVIFYESFFTSDGKEVDEDVLNAFFDNWNDLDRLKIASSVSSRAVSSKFSLNGMPMNMGDIVMTIVQDYANANPSLADVDIRDYFVKVCSGIGVAHIVETQTEFNARSSQSSAQRTVNEVTIPNGDKVYVSTQWRAGKKDANFYKFIDVATKNGWGTIAKI